MWCTHLREACITGSTGVYLSHMQIEQAFGTKKQTVVRERNIAGYFCCTRADKHRLCSLTEHSLLSTSRILAYAIKPEPVQISALQLAREHRISFSHFAAARPFIRMAFFITILTNIVLVLLTLFRSELRRSTS